ncbi:MAG TPA: hypothetical protein IGS53_19875 [Leptolyngbyaceae cyanobacterium M33_DOE_097]|uniref:Uncharacterized protein n=1 Tax=Oscillatoriales cyanobacterium SpSt-418 TaxID=2282169 RepID=A0A7C3KCV6_9CYAN|nr:hypothetical protein [Leptolyngbyaceae cyanobacterium M33_DOE_097]
MGRFTRFSPKVVGERSLVALVVTVFVSSCFARSPQTSSNSSDPERAAANPPTNRASTLAQAPRPANAAACERELRSRLTQEFGSQLEITVNSAEIYFTSNAEQGIRGTATVIFQSDNRAADYRYDCTVNLRTGTVSQLTYQRINQTSPTPTPGGSSVAICERTLRDRITQSTGEPVIVTINSANPYFISNAEEGVRGTATARFSETNRSTNYRYDCAVNIRTGQVTQLTYEPTTSPPVSSTAICERTLRERLAQETGSSSNVTITSANPYFISSTEEGVRGTANARVVNTNRLINYRYDCVVNIRDRQVTRFTYQRVTPPSPPPVVSSRAICERELQKRIAQQTNGRVDVKLTSANTYFISSTEEEVRGTATARFQNTNRSANYRFDCAVNLRTGQVTQFTYRRTDPPVTTPQTAYNRGYARGRQDALNNRPYNPFQGVSDNGWQNNAELSRAYTRGYADGFQSVSRPEPEPPVNGAW